MFDKIDFFKLLILINLFFFFTFNAKVKDRCICYTFYSQIKMHNNQHKKSLSISKHEGVRVFGTGVNKMILAS